MKPRIAWPALLLVFSLGCGGKAEKDASTQFQSFSAKDKAAGKREGEPPAKARGPAADNEPLSRKIIYTAELVVVVEDLTAAENSLREQVKEHEALVAHSAVEGSAGSPRVGRWTVRVPVAKMDPFIQAVLKLGVPEQNTTDSEDVTDRYYDLEASVKNYKAEEEALRKLLEKAAGKIEDVIAVRKELAQLREKIEHLEGQLRRLQNLTALTTVQVTLREIKDYVPPQAPTFGAKIDRTFSASLDAIVAFGKGVVLAAVAAAPWVPLALVVLVPLWVLVRRGRVRPA
jgi:hypothetical protein